MAKTSCLGLLWIVPLLSFPLLQSVSAQSFQLKSCFRWDGSASNNIPCNPEANVSACCGQGSTCRTNIFCENSSGLKIVGECTDRSWADPACPWRLNAYKVQPAERIFSYQANTTMCSDGTLCPKTYPSTAENTTCCDAHQGKEEIVFRNKEKIPEDLSDLPEYYANAGYTIPGLVSTTLTSATPSSIAVGQSFATPSPSSTPISSPMPQPASTGLGPGAKAGIGVGVGLGSAILAALLAVLFFLRRRSRQNKTNQVLETESQLPSYPSDDVPGGNPPKSELSEVETLKPEMEAQDPSYRHGELPTNTARVEMDGSHVIYS